MRKLFAILHAAALVAVLHWQLVIPAFAAFGGTVDADSYPTSGRPGCDPRGAGALGDGVTTTTDDAAFTACLNNITALLPTVGGVIIVSAGHYCLSQGTFAAALAASTTPITMRGVGSRGGSAANPSISWVDTCGADVDLIHFHANSSGVENLFITGAQFTTNPAHNALTFGGAAGWARNVSVRGGYYACLVTSSAWLDTLTVCASSYGAAVVEVQGSATIKSASFDGVAPPAYNHAPINWSANASASPSQPVCVPTCAPGNFVISYTAPGTTGSVAPTVQKYGTIFADGTASAVLAAPVGQYGLEINGLTSAGARADSSGATDYTGMYAWSIHVTGQSSIFTSNGDFATGLNGEVLVDGSNSQLVAVKSSFSAAAAAASAGVKVTGSALSAQLYGVGIVGNTVGVEYDAGTALTVVGGQIAGVIGVSSTGINVGTAGLSNIGIGSVSFGNASNVLGTAIAFANGGSDYVEIGGNNLQYVTTPVTGTITGTHNCIETNGTQSCQALTPQTPLGAPYGGSGIASPTAHSILQSEGGATYNLITAASAGRFIVDQGAGSDWLAVAMSGDATLAANGALTIGSAKVTNAKLANPSLMVNGVTCTLGSSCAPAGAEQGFTLLNVVTGASVASISDASSFSASYNDYMLVFDNCTPATNGTSALLQYHSGGSFQSSGYLNFTGGVTTAIDLGNGSATIGSTDGFSMVAYIHNVNSTSVHKMTTSNNGVFLSNGGAIGNAISRGLWNGGLGVVDGWSFAFGSGNISACTVREYGLKPSL